jgi:hypothetical protein
MKSLNEFKNLVEEEKSDYSKFDVLVRAGLANKAQLQRIHRILDKMQDDRPQFNNADKMILQNLFNKMVDLITNNKQIFQRTKQAVREGVMDTSDSKYTLTSDPETGRPKYVKTKAHRIVMTKNAAEVSDTNNNIKEETIIEADSKASTEDPPVMLMLKRKAIRIYPDKTKVALYYNSKLDKHFTIPYGAGVDSVLQSEEVELEEAVMDTLHKIVSGKQAQSVKFANGQTRKVDHYTASAITQVHKAVNDENKKKLADMVHKSPAHFEKVASFAFSKVK